MASRPSVKEYRVKLADPQQKKIHVMRFKHPHKCDLGKLIDPILQRQEVQEQELDEAEAKKKEEWRKRKRYRQRKPNPEDQPWVLREKKKDGAVFYGRKEGGINTSASYYIMKIEGGDFEATPIHNWYDFVPPVKYNYLNDEEAEERFEKRNKTLNYFSIMVSKRIRESEGVVEEEEVEKGKGASAGFRSVDSDSDDDFSSSGSDEEGGSSQKKKKKGGNQNTKKGSKQKKDTKKKQKLVSVDSEAGEESDEGDFESKEMDYSTSSSSEEDEERIKAVREEPRDDAEVERKEEREIDKVFDDSSSEGEDKELTESGKQLKELIHRHEGESNDEGDEPVEEETKSSLEETEAKDSALKQDVSTTSASGSAPPTKKQKLESPSTILPEEVKKYLTRKPMTSKALVKKFVKLKTELDKGSVVNLLGNILKSIPQIDKQKIKGKIYLSIRPEEVT